MQAFELKDLVTQGVAEDQAYLEFLRADSCSAGLYRLAAGSTDPQQPHREDEIYIVMRGRGVIRVGDEDRAVQPGSVIFVETGVEHRFHSISADLAVLVVFAPPESMPS